jgi:hypothetical protein
MMQLNPSPMTSGFLTKAVKKGFQQSGEIVLLEKARVASIPRSSPE